jgi:CRP-like cAMP-binding protein
LDHDVIALTRCQIGIVPHERLSDITETMPHLTRVLWLMTLIDAAVHREWIVGMGRRTATARIAHLFCELCARLDPVGLVKEHSYQLPVSQQQLSDALGLSLVHTNRMLASLRKNGLLTFADQTVTIRDWAGLMHLAQFDPSYLCLRLEPR